MRLTHTLHLIARNEMEWQPIETAPKDGTLIVVWPPTWQGATSSARYNDNRHAKTPRPFWSRLDDMGRVSLSRDNQPTHWMPAVDGPTT